MKDEVSLFANTIVVSYADNGIKVTTEGMRGGTGKNFECVCIVQGRNRSLKGDGKDIVLPYKKAHRLAEALGGNTPAVIWLTPEVNSLRQLANGNRPEDGSEFPVTVNPSALGIWREVRDQNYTNGNGFFYEGSNE